MTQATTIKRIGFIGTGIMGRPMAEHLMAAGFELAVYNRTVEKTNLLVAAGARLAQSPADAARDADLVITMLGFPSDVEDVYLGTDGLLTSARPGTYLIDMTTSSPELAREIHDAGEVAGLHAFDAPVTGGEAGAQAGTLTIFCGTDEKTLAPVTDALKAMGRLVIPFGEAGNGQVAKLANQVALSGCMLGLVEGLAFAKQGGLDMHKTLGALMTGTAASAAMRAFGDKILDGDYRPGFQVKHYVKDLRLALEAAEDEELTLPGAETAAQLYALLQEIGGGAMGTQALALAYTDERTGAEAGLDWSALDDPDDDAQTASGGSHAHGHAHDEGCGCGDEAR